MLERLESIFRMHDIGQLDCLRRLILENYGNITGNWHPLGFVIFKLVDTNPLQYRLHVWPKNKRIAKNPNWQIHNHIFDLESLVLVGKVGSEAISVSNAPTRDATHQLYRVKYTNYGSDLVNSGVSVNLHHLDTSWALAGEKYSIDKGCYHQSCVSVHDKAATLVRTNNISTSASPMVVGEIGGDDRICCPSKQLDKNEAAEVLYEMAC